MNLSAPSSPAPRAASAIVSLTGRHSRAEIVFIESDVADIGVLRACMPAGQEVHMLDAAGDGLRQIAAILRGREGIDALHLISHGSPGVLHLGSLKLDAAMATAQQAVLQEIADSLSPGADLLLYGCQVGAGDGAALLAAIAQWTGCQLAASSGPVGCSALGGSWELDLRHGRPASAIVLGPARRAYRHVLVIPSISSVSVPADNSYGRDANLDFTVNYPVNIAVTGTPRLSLVIGATTRYANYVSGSGGKALLFRYTVQNGDNDLDGITITALELNGGNLSGSNMTLRNVGSTNGVLVLTNTSPVITGLDGDSVAWGLGGTAVKLDQSTNGAMPVSVSDSENDAANWGGTTLTVWRKTGLLPDPTAADVFSLVSDDFSVVGTELRTGGITFATYSNNAGVLSVSFSGASASNAMVQAVLRAVSYANASPTGDTVLRFTLSDGIGDTGASVSVTSNRIYVSTASEQSDGWAANGFSLREALARSRSQAGADTIYLTGQSGTITLSGSAATLGDGDTLSYSGVSTALTIAGSGGGALVLSGASSIGVANSATLEIAANISGVGSLNKISGSSLTLSGNNSYTGGTTITNGSLILNGGHALSDSGAVLVNNSSGAGLVLGASETIGSLAGSGSVALGANTLTLAGSDSGDFSGSIDGSGGLSKSGSASLTLSGADTYTGATAVGAGSLLVDGSLAGTSAVLVASGATLGGSGSIGTSGLNGAVTVQAGATLAPGSGGTAILTLNDGLSMDSGSTLAMELNGDTAGSGHDQLVVRGAVTLAGALSASLGYTPVPGQQLTLIDNDGSDAVAGTFTGLAEGATLSLGGHDFRISYVGGDGNDVVLTAPVANTAPVITGLDGDSAAWQNGGAVALDQSANGGAATVSDAQNDAANWNGATLSVSRVTAGLADAASTDVLSLVPAGFTVNGTDLQTGGLTFATYSSADGTLSVQFSGGASNVSNALVQAVLRSVSYASASPTGDTTLRFTLSDGSADVSVTSNRIYVSSNTDQSDGKAADGFSLREALARSVSQAGADTVYLTGQSGTITLSGSAATLGAGDALSYSGASGALTIAGSGGGALVLGGASSIGVTNSATLEIAADISGSGSLNKISGSSLTLSGNNSYTGGTTITNGSLILNGGHALSDSGAVLVNNSSGAGLVLGASETIGALSGTGSVALGANTLTLAGSDSGDFSGSIDGSGGLEKSGSASQTLSGSNTYTGGTNISAGVLSVGGSAIADASAVSIGGAGTLALNASETIGSLAGSGSVTLASHTLTVGGDNSSTSFSGVISGTGGLSKAGSGSLALSGSNNFSGATTISSGTLSVSGGHAIADTGAVTVSGGATLSVGASETIGSLAGSGSVALGANTLTLAGSDSSDFSGSIDGSGGLSKSGSASQTLSGADTYTGATAVGAGSLLVDGSLAGTSAVLVASGATLGGSGSIGTSGLNGAVTVQAGATLAPGSGGTAILTLNDGLSMDSGSTLAMELNGDTAGSGHDQLVVRGAVTLAGALSASLGYTPVPGQQLTLIDNDGSDAVSGTFTGLAEGATLSLGGHDFRISYVGGDGNDVVLTAPVANTAPVITGLDGDSAAWQNGGAVALDQSANGGAATVSDAQNDAANWNGATLSVSRVTAGLADAASTDVLSLVPAGFTVNGTDLQTGGLTFATYSSADGTLSVQFSGGASNVSNALVQAVLRSVSYASASPTGDATLRFTLSDGSADTSADVSVTSNRIYVSSNTDQSDGKAADGFSLREALARSVSQAGADTVYLSGQSGTITLSGSAATLGAGDALSYSDASGALTIAGSGGGGLALSGASSIGVAYGATLDMSAAISGTSGLNKTGSGTLTLSGINTYTGATTVAAGTLAISSDNAIADTSAVTVSDGATLSMDAFDTIGSLAGSGSVTVLYNLDIGGNNSSTTFAGNIHGAGGISKTGSGSLTLSGNNDYSGQTRLNSGSLIVNGALNHTGRVYVEDGTTLSGAGSIGGYVSMRSGATLAPGDGVGTLTLNGGLGMTTDTTLSMQLNGDTAGSAYDQLLVNGAVNLRSATLSLSLGYAPLPGASLLLINNDGADAVTGTFAGLAEGSTLTLGGTSFSISYAGGTGNDVVLTALAPNAAPLNTVPAAQNLAQDMTLVFDAAHGNLISIHDADAGGAALQVTLSVSHGRLSLSGVNGLSFSSGDGSADAGMIFSGSQSAINTALSGLSFTPDAGYSGVASIQLVTNDNGNSGAGGAQSDSDTVSLNVIAVVAEPEPAPQPPVVSNTVDGVSTQTEVGTDPNTGLSHSTVSVPIVTTGRSDDAGSAHASLADIPLDVGGGAGAGGPQARLTVSLPTGAGLRSDGASELLSNAQAQLDLFGRIHALTGDGSATQLSITAQGADFLASLPSATLLATRTLTPLAAPDGLLSQPIIVSGNSSTPAAGAPANPTAIGLVIDASALPAGTVLQLDNVDFAAVIGSATLRGGDGRNYVVGDDAAQNIVLGADDDILFGGGGDDIIGSAGGADQLDGGSGNDRLFGGIGNDGLAGGSGDDMLQGGRSDLGRWDFYLNGQGQIAARHQTALYDPGASETLAYGELDASAAGLGFGGADSATLQTLALLYRAAFNRAADLEGLSFWAASGLDATALVRDFARSAEWAEGLGRLDDAGFVSAVYQNALGHAGSGAEQSAALAVLHGAGDAGQARLDLFASLAFGSAARAAAQTAQGIALGTATLTQEQGWIKGSGDDRLAGGAGNDILVGGDGSDTAVYAGARSNYKIVLSAGGAVAIVERSSGDTDQIRQIEKAEFSDASLDLGFTAAAPAALQQEGLMYQAVLGRAADIGGLNFWLGAKLSTAALASSFIASTEFVARHGTLDDAAFVRVIEQNALQHPADAASLQRWTDYLGEHTRGEMVAALIGSPEVLAAQFGTQGLWLA